MAFVRLYNDSKLISFFRTLHNGEEYSPRTHLRVLRCSSKVAFCDPFRAWFLLVPYSLDAIRTRALEWDGDRPWLPSRWMMAIRKEWSRRLSCERSKSTHCLNSMSSATGQSRSGTERLQASDALENRRTSNQSLLGGISNNELMIPSHTQRILLDLSQLLRD